VQYDVSLCSRCAVSSAPGVRTGRLVCSVGVGRLFRAAGLLGVLLISAAGA
jgi:hypothetical protein